MASTVVKIVSDQEKYSPLGFNSDVGGNKFFFFICVMIEGRPSGQYSNEYKTQQAVSYTLFFRDRYGELSL